MTFVKKKRARVESGGTCVGTSVFMQIDGGTIFFFIDDKNTYNCKKLYQPNSILCVFPSCISIHFMTVISALNSNLTPQLIAIDHHLKRQKNRRYVQVYISYMKVPHCTCNH